MEITTNGASLHLLWPIITDVLEAHAHLSRYIKICGTFLMKPVNLSDCSAAIDVIYNELCIYFDTVVSVETFHWLDILDVRQ